MSFIKTPQLRHQAKEFELRKDERVWALWWEMGLGKTKVTLDVAAYQFTKGEIQCLIVMAPNAVYKNWITVEAPRHLGVPYAAIPYPKTISAEDTFRQQIFLDHTLWTDRLRVYCISYDSLGKTFHGLDYSLKVATMFKCMIVADESTALGNPSSKQTKAAKKLREMCERAWILSGTPVTESPYLAHSQIEFLDTSFWEGWGFKSLPSFKSHFGKFEWKSVGHRQEKRVPHRIGYRRLDHLNRILGTISSRLLKEDSDVELPPKTYAVRTFEMTKKQGEAYEQLRKEFYLELEAQGSVEAKLAITRIMRLQQILCGYVKVERHQVTGEVAGMPIVETETEVVDIVDPDDNPRLQLLLALIAEASHKVIVWCRFRRDVDLIMEALGDEAAVRYDGATSEKQREITLRRFKDPADSAKVLVANVQSISMGVTLIIAKTMIYYSNDFRAEPRVQSEDRNHRIGQDVPVLIIDLCAEGKTVDSKIIKSLRDKFDVAAQVTGDRYREWIEPP